MPEALAIVVVFVVAVIVYVGAWIQSRDPARQNVEEDRAQLRQHHAWLLERLRVAEREAWDEEMIRGLAAEITAAERRLNEPSTAR